jgi:hypothetical protein
MLTVLLVRGRGYMKGTEVTRDIHCSRRSHGGRKRARVASILITRVRTHYIMALVHWKKGEQDSECTFIEPKNSMFPIWPWTFSKILEQSYSQGVCIRRRFGANNISKFQDPLWYWRCYVILQLREDKESESVNDNLKQKCVMNSKIMR